MNIPSRKDIEDKRQTNTAPLPETQNKPAPEPTAKAPETQPDTILLTWTQPEVKDAIARTSLSPFLRQIVAKDVEAANFINTAIACFVMSTLVRPNPLYTFLDFPVPVQLQDKLATKTIGIDGTDKRGVIHINR